MAAHWPPMLGGSSLGARRVMAWWFGRILTFKAFADDALCVGDVISDGSAGIADSSDDRSLVGFACFSTKFL